MANEQKKPFAGPLRTKPPVRLVLSGYLCGGLAAARRVNRFRLVNRLDTCGRGSGARRAFPGGAGLPPILTENGRLSRQPVAPRAGSGQPVLRIYLPADLDGTPSPPPTPTVNRSRRMAARQPVAQMWLVNRLTPRLSASCQPVAL